MENLPEKITDAIANLHWAEGFAVVFGIVYVVLAARENVWCWAWGIVSCVLWAWASFFIYNLWIDVLLQLFYVGVSFWGIWHWLHGNKDQKELKISTLNRKQHIFIISAGLILTFVTGYFFDKYTPAAATYLDAFTTVFSIVTTFMVVRKILENWLYWIVIDAVFIYLFASRGSVLFTALFVVYLGVAVAGYFQWRKAWQKETGRTF